MIYKYLVTLKNLRQMVNCQVNFNIMFIWAADGRLSVLWDICEGFGSFSILKDVYQLLMGFQYSSGR